MKALSSSFYATFIINSVWSSSAIRYLVANKNYKTVRFQVIQRISIGQKASGIFVVCEGDIYFLTDGRSNCRSSRMKSYYNLFLKNMTQKKINGYLVHLKDNLGRGAYGCVNHKICRFLGGSKMGPKSSAQ